MAMATCYANYDLSISHGIAPLSATSQHPQQQSSQVLPPTQQQTTRLSSVAAATALVTVTAAASTLAAAASNNLNSQKDYSIPLHVDCSVEYELPNQPKPPAGQRVEPLLMIHPCYFRKMESQRRSPFINNMPSSSRNSTALLPGVSTSANNIASSVTVSSSRRSSTRAQQQSQVILQAQHLHQRQASSAQYNSIQHHNSQQQQLLRPPQNNPQQMSQMSQQALYPVVSIPSSSISDVNGQYIEHASAIRRAAAAAVSSSHRSHQQSRSSATTASQQHKLLHHQQHQSQHNHQQNLLVQNSSTSVASHWDQLAAVATIVTSIAPHNPSIIPPTNMSSRNVCTVKCCSTSNSVVGKRDAMISGGYAGNGTPRTQSGRMSNNTNTSSKHNNEIPSNSHGISTSLVDTTNLRWNTAASLMIDRSPIATVPSNYQAGPDTTPTIIQNTQKINNDNNASIRNNVSSSGKYRQYLRSHRAHPYLATPTPSVSADPSSVASVNHISQGFPQFSTAIAATAAVATTPTFQQHLQQISCYNV